MAKFGLALEKVLVVEGTYSDSRFDAGGKTNYGITETLARAHGYTGDMKDMSAEFVNDVYKKHFWDKMLLDNVDSQSIANEIFDTAVNCGQGTAVRMLQEVLNVLNREGKDWSDVKVDGLIGNETIATLNTAIKKRENNILIFLNVLQGAHYVKLAQNPARRDEMNINGWAKRIALNA